ncbi:MAG: amino acid adenylation domain-containing protein, partial [Acidobacteria bacterium]|nr:amino acid adenylation domain-containing protein [Acidobacteriota bacterium]
QAALSRELSAALAAACRRERVTLFMILLAGVQAVLGRWAGQQDVAVGSPVANRNRVELEPLIGFFVNTLVMRTDLSGDPTGAELLARAREVALEAYAHQDLPFAKLVEELQPDRDLLGTPLFRVMLVLQNAPLPPLALPGLTLAPQPIPSRTAKFDLTLTWTPGGERLDGEVEYRRALYDAATVARLLGHLETLLAALAAEPARRLSQLPLLHAAERAQLLVEWNDSRWAGAEEGWGGSTHQRFAAQAARRPQAVAVAWEGGQLSYGELERRASRLARRLRRQGVGPESLVGICLERGPALLPALLAVHQVGGAYLPLDPTLPHERLAAILSDAGPRLVLADAGGRELLAAVAAAGAGPPPVVCLDAAAADEQEEQEQDAVTAGLPAAPAAPAASAAVGAAGALGPPDPAALAYVLFTSGSTGRPKGVAVPHGALMNVLGWYARELDLARRPGGAEALVLLAITTLSFDIAAVELLLPLLLGGRVELLGREAAGDGARLRAELARTGATLLQGTPVTWQLLVQSGWQGDGGRLLAVTAGEALTADLAGRLLERLAPAGERADGQAAGPAEREAGGQGGLWNLYGPTEAAIYSAGARVAARRLAASTGAPIGGPVANTWLYLLDRGQQPVPIGAAGELYIGGAGLARGYVGRPELTAERFVPDPFAGAARAGSRLYRTGDLARRRTDGQIEFLGRLDHQVKLRGYRIELGEIEAVLARHPAVRECAVAARGAGEARQLVAYIAANAASAAPSPPSPPSVGELRAFLQRRLPAYMVPAAFVALERLPHTPSGKLDRKALPAAAAGGLPEGAVYQAPRGPAEEVLLAVFSELLGAERVEPQGAAADFFALGGHSLLATRLVSRVRDAFGLELPVRSVFEAPTVAAFAAVLEARRRGGATAAAAPAAPVTPLPEAARRGPLPLSFSQERLWFLDQLQPGNAAYNMPAAVRLRGRLDGGRLARGLAAVARRHESLRTTFHAVDGQPFQRVAPGPLPGLRQIDLAALPPARRAALARQLTAAEAAAPFDLERGPLLRARLLRLGSDEQVLLLNMHHIVSDGWSVRLIVRELAALYAGGAAGGDPALPALPVQYADYAAWQRRWLTGEALARQLAYWRAELGGELPVLDLPTDSPRPAVQTFHGGAREGLVPPALAAGLRSLARREGASFFMTLLAAFAVLLARYSGQEDLLIGVPIAGRNRAEVEPLVGFFLNSLVLRID